MAKRALRRKTSAVNPMFYIPEDVDELAYPEGVNAGYAGYEDEDGNWVAYESMDGESTDELGDFSDYNESPETPQVLSIVPPQILRMSDSGSEVVDVIFEVSEGYGGQDYEFRVTKI